MNPPNPFGSPQGGAFQAPSNPLKSSLFQSFGQQNSSNQSQTMGFFPSTSAFGQPPVSNQPSSLGSTIFGQAPAFGQSSTQPSSLPSVSQPPAFGQPSVGISASGFGSTTASVFGQSGGQSQSSVFGQTSSFGQPSAFGQAPGFGQQPPAFGQPSSGFGNTQMSSGSTSALGQPQPVSFGQPIFGQPSTTSASTNVFGSPQSVTQSGGFGKTEFSFKPANEALFKPIFSASPEPANPQTTSMSSSTFGSTGVQTSSSTTTNSSRPTQGFSQLTGAKSGSLGFSFSQPAAAPSISTQNNPLTTNNSSSSSTLQFTFSQPAVPSSSSTKTTTTQPTTPSSFSFAAKSIRPQEAPLFGGSSFGQQSAFDDTKAGRSLEEKRSNLEALGGTNVFARLGKGTKRKDDPAIPSSGQEKPITEEDAPADTDSPRQPPKRPLMRSRGPTAGIFGRALSGIRKDVSHPVRHEAPKESEREGVQVQEEDLPGPAPTRSRDILEKAEQSDSTKAPDLKPQTKAPEKPGLRRESSEGTSYADCTAILCKNVPPALNKREIMEKHFSRYGKVCKIYCRLAKNHATIHFSDHASAARAKKKGKMLHGHELLLLWKKTQSPGEKGSRPAAGEGETGEQSLEETGLKTTSSPLRRPTFRSPAVTSSVTLSRSSPVKKSSSAKMLPFDTEPLKESSTEASSAERPVPLSLLPLIGQVAETAEDKYRLLEQRDKILRQGRPKRTDLVLSKVFVGTCPDMCPEKERYMRETRKQLSIYESIPDSEMADHAAVIKEYSRSSADQEEPLPHELRPLPVLSMTMDYLVTQIMDLGHDNYREWYDFVWNRTRGIRKDITQQHLCCPHTVSLIEKCTRFHVHCAHHLCEEHMSSFDAKINNENMTKCLQSLKEMYQDLAANQVYCQREAEFRQYSVLLRLNDGDILREVQQFRDEVRNSPEVKFAVRVFTAVNSNNFVRFFRLVKGASYLASCLLHRYFNQVRAKALKTLNIAHTIGPRPTAFPVEDVVRMLMFRDAAEATGFMQQYGLNVVDGMVELSRTAYQEPDLPLSQKKSVVILAKKTVLIGQVVHGGPLPNPPQHIPVCSFDLNNKYRGEGALTEPAPSQIKALPATLEIQAPPPRELLTQAVPAQVPDMAASFRLPSAASDETGEQNQLYQSPAQPEDTQQLFQPILQPQPIKPPSPPPKPKPVYSNEDIMAVLDCVIEEVVTAGAREVADAGASYITTALVESSVQVESMVGEVMEQMLQEMSSTEIRLEEERVAEEKRKLEEARRRQEHEAFLVQYSSSLCTELIHEVLDETVKETAASEIQQAVNEKADRVAKCTEQVCDSLVEETLSADIALLAEDILDIELQCIHKYIKKWRDVVAVRRQLKRQMRGFPAAPCCVDPRFKLKALAPSAPSQPSIADLALGMVNLGNVGTLALSSTRLLKLRQDNLHQMRVHYFYQQLLNEKVWAPFDLPALVTENIPDPPERIFWKAVLLLPSDHDSEASVADRILSDWLEVKLGGPKMSDVRKEQPDSAMQTLCVINTLQKSGHRAHKVHISVKASRGPLSGDDLSKVEECCELHGTDALITLLPAMPINEPRQDEQDVPLLSALLQLKQLQQASTWHNPLPLVILVPGPDRGSEQTQKLEEALMLQTLVQEGVISEYTFIFIPETTTDLQGSRQLSHAMQWLLARSPPPVSLSCQTLVHLVEASLSREFSPRVFAHQQERAAVRLPPQDPEPVIHLYNAVLAHIAERVSSQDISRLSWPPCEFSLPETWDFVPYLGWNSTSHLAWLRESILSLQLPQWEVLSSTNSWPEICSSILRYAAQIPVSPSTEPLIMSRLENLLERVRLKRHRTSRSNITMSSWSSQDEDSSSVSCQIPWDDVLEICIDHKLKDWRVPGPPVCEDAVTEDGEILVYFPTDSLKGFQPPEEWIRAVRKTHREKHQEREEASAAACVPSPSLSLRQNLFPSPLEPLEASTAPLDITHTPSSKELLVHTLLQSLEEEKSESRRSMEQLQRWMDGDPVDHLSMPLFIPSSTLLYMPTTIRHPPTARTQDKTLTQVQKSEPENEQPEGAVLPITPPVSMTWRLKELQQKIMASREEELACSLKLNSLLSIVDD
ncbi:germinal-center associated nuclear protein isoform X2 [Halichoeres trimaculatus]|uniref:germinal-center associated nuclear protein isoform X2 n=1 Tax=Halichoeres trimaculatus TaxID=147232 RepID=UPI003D9EC651